MNYCKNCLWFKNHDSFQFHVCTKGESQTVEDVVQGKLVTWPAARDMRAEGAVCGPDGAMFVQSTLVLCNG